MLGNIIFLIISIFLWLIIINETNISNYIDKRKLRNYGLIFISTVFLILNIILFDKNQNEKRQLIKYEEDIYAQILPLSKPTNISDLKKLERLCRDITRNEIRIKLIKEGHCVGSKNNGFYHLGSLMSYLKDYESRKTIDQLTNDFEYRETKLDIYRNKIYFTRKCIEDTWSGYDRYLFSSKQSKEYYEKYIKEYISLDNLLTKNISSSNKKNTVPEQTIQDRIKDNHTKEDFERLVSYKGYLSECDKFRQRSFERERERARKEEPLLKKLGRAAKSAKEEAGKAISPARDKAKDLVDQFKEGFNE